MTKAEQYIKDLEAYNKEAEEFKNREPVLPRLEFETVLKSQPNVLKIDRFGNLDIIVPCKNACFTPEQAVQVGKWILDNFSEATL